MAQCLGMTRSLREKALAYHLSPRPGKISIEISKPANTAADLALAYTPGVAEPVKEIAADAENAYRYTAKGNLVAVISNGTAILGMGNLGALASKPVMEGKALLFKRFGGINAIDIEVGTEDPRAFIDAVALIATTFGGINLEDIRAPECFEIEQALIERCDIPVFHDDQHGTAIVTAAGLLNALELQGKNLHQAKVVCLGAGAAATACMRLLIRLGLPREHLYMVDRAGVICSARTGLAGNKVEFINDNGAKTLAQALQGADVCIGLAGPDLLTVDMLMGMADKPVLFACSNPDPEINPLLAKAARPDLIMATGRSDYPNQVNNVLAFPYIFRGALDVRARYINIEMKLAAVEALRNLARESVPASVLSAYNVDFLVFGVDYILPTPLDWRLLGVVSAAVARAAVTSGAARLPYPAHYPL